MFRTKEKITREFLKALNYPDASIEEILAKGMTVHDVERMIKNEDKNHPHQCSGIKPSDLIISKWIGFTPSLEWFDKMKGEETLFFHGRKGIGTIRGFFEDMFMDCDEDEFLSYEVKLIDGYSNYGQTGILSGLFQFSKNGQEISLWEVCLEPRSEGFKNIKDIIQFESEETYKEKYERIDKEYEDQNKTSN